MSIHVFISIIVFLLITLFSCQALPVIRISYKHASLHTSLSSYALYGLTILNWKPIKYISTKLYISVHVLSIYLVHFVGHFLCLEASHYPLLSLPRKTKMIAITAFTYIILALHCSATLLNRVNTCF